MHLQHSRSTSATMPSRTRPSSRVKTPARSKIEKTYGFDPYPTRRMAARNRTINYREPGSDSENEVIYVGTFPKGRHIVPNVARCRIMVDEESCLAETSKESHVAKTAQHSGRAIFHTLPYEIHQNIAKYIEDDQEVASYAMLCKQTRDSISASVWRARFAKTFDMPVGQLGPLELAQKYAYRRDIAHWVCFDLKKYGGAGFARDCKAMQEASTKKCLLVMRDLIVESNARKSTDLKGNQTIVGHNYDYIRNWITHGQKTHTDIVDAVANTTSTSWDEKDIVSANTGGSLVLVIQLCLTSFSIHPDDCNNTVAHFDMSQREAYADLRKQPVFVGAWKQDINARWLLNTVNFFKLHLKASNGEGLLAQQYEDLERDQLPQVWLGRIKEGTQPIGSHWKSAYTFMGGRDALMKLRLHGNEDEPIVDDGDAFSDLTIFFDDSKFSSNNWPKAFEILLGSNPYNTTSPTRSRRTRSAKAITNKQYELKAFFGTSGSSRLAHFFGRIHGLPEQQGIPGFQRISLIKFFLNAREYDPSQVWAYEGCVLPGGRIIVGRWWDLTADPANPIDIFGGPFIWWNVDNSAAEPPISSEEALEFLKSIHDPSMGFS